MRGSTFMRRYFALLLLFFFAHGIVFGQNAYQVLRAAKQIKYKALVTRHLRAPVTSQQLAVKVAALTRPITTSHYYQQQVINRKGATTVIPQIHIVTEFRAPLLKDPTTLWGSYQYLKAIAALAREEGMIVPKYINKWKKIYSVSHYRGAHHIVNKSTLKEIYWMMKRQATQEGVPFTVNLADMQKNAPGAFHPFHGNPEHAVVFHNLNKQLLLYKQGGVKAILKDYFTQMENLHKRYPNDAPPVCHDVVKNTILETKLWCETFHLRWE